LAVQKKKFGCTKILELFTSFSNFAQKLSKSGDTGNAEVINEDAQTPSFSRHGNLWTDED
jgi:hypothetical protein